MNNISHAQVVLVNANALATSPEQNDEISVYGKVFDNLIEEGGPLGKILPINLKIGDTEYALGAVTLNRSGNSSIFLELPGTLHFDHLTVVRNLKVGNHHFTQRKAGKRIKVCPLNATPLTNGTLYVMTLIIGSTSHLKIAPRQMVFPSVPIQHIPRLQDAFITNGKPEGVSVINGGLKDGVICLQFFLIPTGVDFKVMNFYYNPIKHLAKEAILENEDGSNTHNLVIPHEYQSEYMIGVKTISFEKYSNPKILAFSYESPKARYFNA